MSATGTIQASAGDSYKVGGNFLNTSVQANNWDTLGAVLEFYNGGETDHTLQLPGADQGGRPADRAWPVRVGHSDHRRR